MSLSRKTWVIFIIVAALAAAAVAGWLAVPRLQALRADALLDQANEDITAANEALAGIDMSLISLEGFVSQEKIRQTSEALAATLPVVEEAGDRVEQARAAALEAAGFYRLPAGYADYLAVKGEVATLRLKQLDGLRNAIRELQPLYDNGDVIFTAVEEMDRLWGQIDFYTRTLQDSPEEARAGLQQAAAAMRALKQQVDSRNESAQFFLLAELSGSIAENTRLAELGAELADAVAAQDQSRAQQAAAALERQLVKTTDTSGFVTIWVEQSLEPRLDSFARLQEEQEELDQRATDLFKRRSQS